VTTYAFSIAPTGLVGALQAQRARTGVMGVPFVEGELCPARCEPVALTGCVSSLLAQDGLACAGMASGVGLETLWAIDVL
jgi:hypothetical protein